MLFGNNLNYIFSFNNIHFISNNKSIDNFLQFVKNFMKNFYKTVIFNTHFILRPNDRNKSRSTRK